jgi:hypothetical protein
VCVCVCVCGACLAVRVLHLIKPVAKVLPEVKSPERNVRPVAAHAAALLP